MFCWRGVIPNVIPDSILTPSLRVRIRRPRHAEETSAHDQPDPRPTPQGHRNHQRDRHLGIRPPRLGRAALHHLWDPRLPLPRRPPQATRPLPQLDPQGRRQDRHPAPQRRTACPIRTLVPGPPAPTGTPGRTRSPLPGDHRERTTPGNRPETKNTGHLERAGQTVKERRSFSITGGMCPRCEGRGSVTDFDLSALYDDSLSLNEGALTIPGYSMDGWYGRIYRGCGFFDPDKPIRKYTKNELHDLLHKEPTKIKVDGINLTYEGLIPKIQKSFLSKDVDTLQPHIRAFVERAITFTVCPECDGTRLSEAARSSKINGINIAGACAMQISDLAEWVRGLDEPSVGPLLASLQETLDSFVEIGLGYLSLDRSSGTLSGGEAQRTKMIRHLGSSLTAVTYVFDEPTIGLHPHDIQRMNDLLLLLRDKGNTVLVVEHKPETIQIADHAVDLGPGAGPAGGEVVFEGTVEGLRASDTVTGRHLSLIH